MLTVLVPSPDEKEEAGYEMLKSDEGASKRRTGRLLPYWRPQG